jgi:arylsulfatase A-like enzyme
MRIERRPVTGIAFAAAACLAGGVAAAESRCNVVMIHGHDLGQHLHCYGVKTVQSPNLDRFASEGVMFTKSFCTAPGCSPSRASLFTGRYPHSNGVLGLTHKPFNWELNPGERHLAQILRDAGYRTTAVGVTHETHSGSERLGYEKYFPASMASQATDRSIAVLAQMKQDPSRPFFLFAGYIEPHRLPYDEPPAGLIAKDHTFPGKHLQPDDALGVEVPGYLRDTPGARRELAGLQGAVKHVDAQFGRVLDALNGLGLASNTLVIFTTDHGIAMPRAKCTLYDPGVEVAFLLRYPARKGWFGGRTFDALVSNIDCLPTVLDLAGVPVPAAVQGRSLAPLLDGGAYAARDALFTELTYHDYYDPRRAVRTATHKLIVNFTSSPAFMDSSQCWRPLSDVNVPANPACAQTPHVELYDLAKDRWEQNDVAQDPQYAAVRADLLKRLNQHMVETQDPIVNGAVTSPHHLEAARLLKGERP